MEIEIKFSSNYLKKIKTETYELDLLLIIYVSDWAKGRYEEWFLCYY